MTLMSNNPNNKCSGKEPYDSCLSVFPRKDQAGLCGRCTVLDPNVTPDHNRREEIKV